MKKTWHKLKRPRTSTDKWKTKEEKLLDSRTATATTGKEKDAAVSQDFAAEVMANSAHSTLGTKATASKAAAAIIAIIVAIVTATVIIIIIVIKATTATTTTTAGPAAAVVKLIKLWYE